MKISLCMCRLPDSLCTSSSEPDLFSSEVTCRWAGRSEWEFTHIRCPSFLHRPTESEDFCLQKDCRGRLCPLTGFSLGLFCLTFLQLSLPITICVPKSKMLWYICKFWARYPSFAKSKSTYLIHALHNFLFQIWTMNSNLQIIKYCPNFSSIESGCTEKYSSSSSSSLFLKSSYFFVLNSLHTEHIMQLQQFELRLLKLLKELFWGKNFLCVFT